LLKFAAYCGKIPLNMLQRRGGTIYFIKRIRVERRDLSSIELAREA